MKITTLKAICLLLPVIFLSCSQYQQSASSTAVANLRTEYLMDPLGLDVNNPRLSWETTSAQRNLTQSAYQIIVASSQQLLNKDSGDLWNSGKVHSDRSFGIEYAGLPLTSRTDCYWKVKVWTNRNDSLESVPAYWKMGLLQPADWSAKWTGLDSSFSWEKPQATRTRLSARYFRKTFNSNVAFDRATLYLSGLGIYKLFINGKEIGQAELSPDPSQYDKRVFYNTYDVTKQIQKGENAIGVILGNGRYYAMRWGDSTGLPHIGNFGYPKMLFQLELADKDKIVEQIASDSSWKVTADGPVRSNNEFDGETYDATKELDNWSTAGFDDSNWLTARSVEAPEGRVVAQPSPLITIMDTLKPKSVFEISKGKYIVDMGQNMVGWSEIKIKDGKKGDTVVMRFAERLNPDSSLYTANLRSAEATDRYVMKNGRQKWEPHFTYHGFRYVEVTGYPGKPDVSDFTGKVVYDNLPLTGEFETSNAVINQIYKNAYWGIRGNYRGMPTDCPQRDERMGWLGDRATGSYGESFIFDNNLLYAKWMQDIEDAQLADGSVPDVAPNYWRIYSDNMTWPGAYVMISDMLYQQFGNSKPFETHYASMKKWLEYMREKYMKDYILTKDTYGDWCMPPEDPMLIHSKLPERITAGDYLGTTYYYHMLQLMEKFANHLGKAGDQKEFKDLGINIKRAFNDKYLDVENNGYSNNTATANLLALAFGLAPDSIKNQVFQHIVNTTMNDFGGHISTGLVGAQWIMRTLTGNGRADIAYKLATNTTYPSWGYMAKEGATTIWELWNGNTANPAMNSGNHVMLLGDLVIWFYEDLAGIKNDPVSTGFKKIIMKPVPVDGLDHVKASYHSVHGMIKSEWNKSNDTFDWQVTIPANTTATVFIPAKSLDSITEGGKEIKDSNEMNFVKMENGNAVVELGSGSYHFVSKG